ncbi:MAG TPA: response regulator transcription factor [Actinomycetota bacterium]|nr:response regulator transcription factor [Actinomycetota bacterium]
MRILVVEDEVDLADALATGLRRDGYAVDVAYEGNAALERITVNAYDVLLLDVNLPNENGRSIARRVRDGLGPPGAADQPRILMLTALGDVEDRVAGLDDGADDYLVKPFSFDELSARVRALLRRDAGRSGSLLEVGSLVLDTGRHLATKDGSTLDLTPKEFALLRYFMSRPGQVLSQEELLEHVWDENADPFTQTVRVTVMNLRRKLSRDGGEQPIETVVGQGYRLLDAT